MNESPAPRLPLITRIERVIATDVRYLLHGGSWLALGQFIASSSVFILAIAFANLVPRDVYGIYKYVQSVAGILAIFGMSGMNTYIAQAVARGAEATFLSGMKARIRWGFLGAVGGLLVALYYFVAGNMLLAEAFLITAAMMPFVDALGLYNVYLQSKKLFKTAILYFAVVQILSSLAILITVLFTHELLILVTAYFLPLIILRAYFHFRTLTHYPPNKQDDPQAIRYGTHLSVISVLGQIANYIDAIILFHFLGPIAVAVYSFALAPIAQITSLYQKNIPPLALPKLSNRSMKEIDSLLIKRLVLLCAFGALIAGAYVLIAPAVFHLVFPKYVDAIHVSQVLSLLLIIGLPAVYLATAIQAKIHVIPPSWLYVAIVPDALHIVSFVVLVPYLGIYSIIVARAIDAGTTFLINAVQWRYIRELPEERVQ